MMTDADRLATAGRLLYGAQWQTPMAEARKVTLRTVQRWAAKASPIPEGIWTELRADLERHANESRAFARTLPKVS